ncbi:HD domain-containing protein [Phenylobacterium sp.]|uniref:HD domain-containing protein n=1 Tax=Phenylobacterium sp. TaxID=1871053 RepID=UPI0040358CE3
MIKTIPGDCRDLTVHDVTHLDALWEMATLIAGPTYELNPAEGFVLGGAILLHDAGMSVAAFPGGEAEVRATEAWTDICAAILRQNGIEVSDAAVAAPPAELLPEITFAVLRSLHASQAEKMATHPWSSDGKTQFYLIEDVELRQAFGQAIGRIAHSHHWDIEKVADRLSKNVGAGVSLPSSWSVNEVKVACILRTADAAHIDRRRAPSILRAAMNPKGISAVHWSAQNKINQASTGVH